VITPQELQAVWPVLQRWLNAVARTSTTSDPIRSARGMFAGSGLTEALLAWWFLHSRPCKTDLCNTNSATWTPLATNTMGNSYWYYLDEDSPFAPCRFYGAKLKP
jgi:hypothetical protein